MNWYYDECLVLQVASMDVCFNASVCSIICRPSLVTIIMFFTNRKWLELSSANVRRIW